MLILLVLNVLSLITLVNFYQFDVWVLVNILSKVIKDFSLKKTKAKQTNRNNKQTNKQKSP